MKYILNNYYTLRHDYKRTYILGGYNKQGNKNINKRWTSIIHPAYAMILSFFSCPKTINEASLEISIFFNIPNSKIKSFLKALIDKDTFVQTNYGGITNSFPNDIIIPVELEKLPRTLYKPTDFKFTSIDLESRRMYKGPLTIVWMPNSSCLTNCAYCYADRSHSNCIFDIKHVENFLKDARKSGIMEIAITGGDFFIHPHWKSILYLLKKYDYKIDFLSTKKPLSQGDIEIIKQNNIGLQISLDSINPLVCKDLLQVPLKYVEDIKESLRRIDESGITFHIATVLTNYNDSVNELKQLKDFVFSFKNITHWNIRVGFASLYSRQSFDKIKSNRHNIKLINSWIKSLQSTNIRIGWAPDQDINYRASADGSISFNGPLCSANISNLMVLPNGDVTICEQLYWKPQFIIGNIFSNTIYEIWNSSKAIALNMPSLESIKKESNCKSCNLFKTCFKFGNRCYANILKAYGDDNADFPDPRCVKAPEFKIDITHE